MDVHADMSFGGVVQSDIDPDATGDIDDFGNRTIAIHVIGPYNDASAEGAWGEASSGRTWRVTQGGNSDAPVGVSGGLGHWEGDFIFGGGFGDWGVQLIDWDVGKYWYPAEIAGEGSLYVRVRFSTVGSEVLAHLDNTYLTLRHDNGTASSSWQLDIVANNSVSNTPGTVQLQGVGGYQTIAKHDWIANAWYTIEVKQSGLTVQARVWADEIEAIPAFLVSAPVNVPFPWGHDVNDGGNLNWEASGGLSATGIWTCDTDRVWFVPLGGGGGNADDFESIATGWGS